MSSARLRPSGAERRRRAALVLAGALLLASCSRSATALRAPHTSTTRPRVTSPVTVGPALSAKSRGLAVSVAADDGRVQTLVGDHVTVVRVASWTRFLPKSRRPFVGVLVTLEVNPARSVDAVWPSWGCRGAAQGVDGIDNGRGVGTNVHVVADNVSQLLVGVDLTTRRVLFLEADARSNVRTRTLVGITDSFPAIACDDDDPQL